MNLPERVFVCVCVSLETALSHKDIVYFLVKMFFKC